MKNKYVSLALLVASAPKPLMLFRSTRIYTRFIVSRQTLVSSFLPSRLIAFILLPSLWQMKQSTKTSAV